MLERHFTGAGDVPDSDGERESAAVAAPADLLPMPDRAEHPGGRTNVNRGVIVAVATLILAAAISIVFRQATTQIAVDTERVQADAQLAANSASALPTAKRALVAGQRVLLTTERGLRQARASAAVTQADFDETIEVLQATSSELTAVSAALESATADYNRTQGCLEIASRILNQVAVNDLDGARTDSNRLADACASL